MINYSSSYCRHVDTGKPMVEHGEAQLMCNEIMMALAPHNTYRWTMAELRGHIQAIIKREGFKI